MAFGLTTNIMYLFTYYLLTYWHRLAVFNSDALVAYERLHRLALLCGLMLLFGLQNLCV